MAKSIEEIAREVLLNVDLTSKDIPDLDLYIDQITTLLDRTFESNKRNENEKIITKSMVNNYCKKGVVEPIVGKKYSKDRIIEILLVYHLKNTLMIDEIQRVLTPMYEMKKSGEIDICDFYDSFIQDKKEKELVTLNVIEQFPNKDVFSLDDKMNRLRLILTLSALSDVCKSAAQKILDEYYPDDQK